jgi:glycosyltransferase involved in cell wall biosynthesis
MRLHLMGTGPFEDQWRRDTADLRDEVIFHGALDYPEMVSRLRGCDIAVNPIVAGAAQSITNKVGDYAAAGLPVVNSQECEEYRTLLDAYGAGVSCDAGARSIASAAGGAGLGRQTSGAGEGLAADGRRALRPRGDLQAPR